MSALSEDIFNPYRVALYEDLYAEYEALREAPRISYGEEADLWFLSRFDEVREAALDWGSFSHLPSVELDEVGELLGEGNFLDLDPPRHDLLRALLRDRFTVAAVGELEPKIRRTARALVAELDESAPTDLIAGLARPLPQSVICELLGFQGADVPRLIELVDRAMHREPGAVDASMEAAAAGMTLRALVGEVLAERRIVEGDTLIGRILASEVEGRGLGEDALGMTMLLLTAGLETLESAIGNAILLLGSAPEQRELFSSDPSVRRGAIEEVVRFEAPVQSDARTLTGPRVIRDTELPAGARVLLLFGAANRDPRQFADPDRFDIRRDARRHMGFGYGIHFCLGAHLARLEARVALEELLDAYPGYEISAEPERHARYNSRALQALEVRLRGM